MSELYKRGTPLLVDLKTSDALLEYFGDNAIDYHHCGFVMKDTGAELVTVFFQGFMGSVPREMVVAMHDHWKVFFEQTTFALLD